VVAAAIHYVLYPSKPATASVPKPAEPAEPTVDNPSTVTQ